MRKIAFITLCLLAVFVFTGCGSSDKGDVTDMKKDPKTTKTAKKEGAKDEFKYFAETFADINIGRFPIPGFDKLELKQKKLLYFLYEAALSGRDLIWDQHYKHNLCIRRTLEAIVGKYNGDRTGEDFKKFMTYTKRVWFSNGIHHHYSSMKFEPGFTQEYFAQLVKNSPDAKFPLEKGESIDDLLKKLAPIIFDPKVDAKRTSTDASKDLVKNSAINYYEGVTQHEVEVFYALITDKKDKTPVSYGLNSKFVKEKGQIKEKTWKVGGMYSGALEQIVSWLEKASTVSENENQKKALDLLAEYFKTGDLATFDRYSMAWVRDTASIVDVVNGFIEYYNDPLGRRGTYESMVSFKDMEATRRTETISSNAQWFEDNSPIDKKHKKEKVKGVTAKVITIVALGGDSAPTPAIGVNLPNSNWIRSGYGSKSVTLGNISSAYDKVTEGSGTLQEFAYSEEVVKRAKEHGQLGDFLHTDMHEIIGHGSGKLNPGVGEPKETLKNYASVIEETRADLVAYYYILDPKMVELGLIPGLEVGKASYDNAILNGYMRQLTRLKQGDDVEQAHMRNRQLIAKWALELGQKDKVLEVKIKEGKTYTVVNDYEKLRSLFGTMLKEIQRIKSEGDFEAAKKLVETYAVKIDQKLHKEVLERFAKLKVAPYTGFILPKLVPQMKDGEIVDVKVEYPADFTKQMLRMAEKYSFLPTYN